ncbi:MAG: hypothetical protein HC925_08335 [Coleofasciculaceae cyanobacterium SM2_3_26]|nr:hypothetical protein [Coleofasciculaceae cyanobacterium SM2_3_26]
MSRDLKGNLTFGNVYGSVGNVQDSFNTYASPDRQSLAEAAAEIQQLLEQLSQNYPTKTASEKANVATKAIVAIEEKPGVKSKILKALKAGGAATFMELVNHPVINILTPMLESLLEEERT